MPPRSLFSLVRHLLNGNVQEAYNRVQLEDELANPINLLNPLPVGAIITIPPGGLDVHIQAGTNLGGIFGIDQVTAHANEVKLIAGEADAAHVYGKFIEKYIEFARAAGTTQYTAKDTVNVDLLVNAASNASPIVVGTTTNHLLADGDYVTISNVTGNTNANGSYYVKVTTYTATTFALYTDKALTTPRAGNANWISGGDVARLFRLKDILRVDGGSGLITKIRMLTDLKTWTDQFRLHFYNQPVAVIIDNLPYTVLWANRTSREGWVDMPAFSSEDPTNSTAAYSLGTMGAASGSGFPLEVHNAETPPCKDIWMRIENMSAGTPAALQQFFLSITLDPN